MSRTLVIGENHELDGVRVAPADMPSMAAQFGMFPGIVDVKVNNVAIIVEYETEEDGSDPEWCQSLRRRLRLP